MNLFINYYIDPNEQRNHELQTCLYNNIGCGAISRIYLIGNIEPWTFNYNKVTAVTELSRPAFKGFFNIINKFTQPNDINIIANSDIYFENVDYNDFAGLTHNDCFALSRWDVQPDGSTVHYNNSGSQDTWIFRGAIKMVEGANFTQGVAGCDNKIAYLLKQAGYNVTNPSLSIKTYHLHNSGVRYYDRVKRGQKIYRLPHPRVNVPIT